MSDADIVKALRASIKFDAIHGTETELAICGSQMIRAADEITSLRTELAAMRERLHDFTSFVLSCRSQNTDEWMESLVEQVNDICAVVSDGEKWSYGGDWIYKIPPTPTDTSKETGNGS